VATRQQKALKVNTVAVLALLPQFFYNMNEKRIEKRLVDGVKRLGGIALKFWPISFSGFPDRIVLLPGGRINFVELKTTGKTLRPRQKIVRRLLERLGFQVYKIDTIELLTDYLNTIELL
jgi:hypothetical protein